MSRPWYIHLNQATQLYHPLIPSIKRGIQKGSGTSGPSQRLIMSKEPDLPAQSQGRLLHLQMENYIADVSRLSYNAEVY